MHITLLGATGRAGQCILAEALRRGHTVTGVARGADKLPGNITKIADDLSDIGRLSSIISGSDAVVSAYAPPREDTNQLIAVTSRIVEAVRKAGGLRLIVVGGCGSLNFAPGVTVLESGHWPAQFVPVATSHAKTLEALRTSGINWTYFSPPMSITTGERTGQFRIGGGDLIKDSEGKSRVSFEDYAVALIDEVERPQHERARFTIGY